MTVLVQLLSNRAQCSLDLGNNRSCILDCDAAIGLLNSSDLSTATMSIASKQKIHFRKCKALISVRRWRDCIHACNTAEENLKGDPSQLKVSVVRQYLFLCSYSLIFSFWTSAAIRSVAGAMPGRAAEAERYRDKGATAQDRPLDGTVSGRQEHQCHSGPLSYFRSASPGAQKCLIGNNAL